MSGLISGIFDNHIALRKKIDEMASLVKEELNKEKENLKMKNDNLNTGLKLSPPWQTYAHELEALFEGDQDVKVSKIMTDSDGAYVVNVEVMDHRRFIALEKLLPDEKIFGNVMLKIRLYDVENKTEEKEDILEVIRDAFDGNPNFKGCVSQIDQIGTKFNYAVFACKVVQFFNDNYMQDYAGNWSGLMSDVAHDVLGDIDGVFFCMVNTVKPEE